MTVTEPDLAERPARPPWKRWAKRALKIVLGLAILGFVGRHVLLTWHDLQAKGASLRVEPLWIVIGGVLYLLGLIPCGFFYGRVLQASPTPVGSVAAIRAYLVSQLGKYVPGKAMVVVMRVGLLGPYGARPATAAFATLYETLTMMAAGGILAAVLFALSPIPPLTVPIGFGKVVAAPLALLSLGLGGAFWVVVEPRVFPRIATVFRLPFPGVGPDALPRCSRRLLLEGLGLTAVGWVLLGLSQVAIVRALVPTGLEWSVGVQAIASVALATVAGFALPIFPAGLFVREVILGGILTSAIGHDRAVVSAIALRLTWVVVEILIVALLSWVRPPLPTQREPEP